MTAGGLGVMIALPGALKALTGRCVEAAAPKFLGTWMSFLLLSVLPSSTMSVVRRKNVGQRSMTGNDGEATVVASSVRGQRGEEFGMVDRHRLQLQL
ncbi:hypothetical protein ZEAMMB73_Zm00001d042224 [Zea mays]|uniref:Uncharacterized protein n=1 Tax=Zea mays TaxID=4577 RepID=A0A1D6N288_MAIZE|nr:hypothetical protein ZEAMMB73_Zm00001d042224 [Zea mays]